MIAKGLGRNASVWLVGRQAIRLWQWFSRISCAKIRHRFAIQCAVLRINNIVCICPCRHSIQMGFFIHSIFIATVIAGCLLSLTFLRYIKTFVIISFIVIVSFFRTLFKFYYLYLPTSIKLKLGTPHSL